MQQLEVTDRVWHRILALKSGKACRCCGDWTASEAQALDLYGSLAERRKRIQFFAQIGQSLDGRVATEAGDAQDVSGPGGLAHLHRLRAVADAVVIGVKTALHDDPQLTVRLVEGQSPARVVIDPDGRLANDASLLAETSARRIVIQAVDKERPPGVEVITLERASWIDPKAIASALANLGFRRVLVEGGGITITQFLEAELLNRLHVAVSPLIIGSGPQSLTTSPVGTLAMARRPKTQVYELGSDILFDCGLTPFPDPVAAVCAVATFSHT